MSISEPATALPDGWAQMKIDGRVVTFDTTQFRPAADELVVCVHLDGQIAVQPVRCEGPTSFGPRGAMDQWRPGRHSGSTESSPVIVLGVVVA